jgi:hypothetical protein
LIDGIAVRIQGEPDVIGEISELVQASEQAEFLRVEQDDTGGIGADFALETVATIIAIVSGLFFDNTLIPKLWDVLHRHRGTRILIETPTQSISIESTGELTTEKLKTVLDALVDH